jgi:hypothetical protein
LILSHRQKSGILRPQERSKRITLNRAQVVPPARQSRRAANGPPLIKGTTALFVAAACLGFLTFLLSPVKPPTDGIERRFADVIAIRPGAI